MTPFSPVFLVLAFVVITAYAQDSLDKKDVSAVDDASYEDDSDILLKKGWRWGGGAKMGTFEKVVNAIGGIGDFVRNHWGNDEDPPKEENNTY